MPVGVSCRSDSNLNGSVDTTDCCKRRSTLSNLPTCHLFGCAIPPPHPAPHIDCGPDCCYGVLQSRMQKGLLSRDGFSVVDDTDTALWDGDKSWDWRKPRAITAGPNGSRRRDCHSAPPPSAGVSKDMERDCHQNDSLADGYRIATAGPSLSAPAERAPCLNPPPLPDQPPTTPLCIL